MPVTEAEFRSAVLPFTLHYEGGFSIDPNDPGNWTGGKVGVGKLLGTKYGIAANSHPTLDIKNLTLAQASDIYWTDYAVKPGFTALALPMLLEVFDAGVNCGPTRARAWLALASAKATQTEQLAAFTAQNLAYHKSLATWSRYGTGWSSRIAACQKQALLLLAAHPVAVPSHLPGPAAEIAPAGPKAATQPQAGLVRRFVTTIAGAFAPAPSTQGAIP